MAQTIPGPGQAAAAQLRRELPGWTSLTHSRALAAPPSARHRRRSSPVTHRPVVKVLTTSGPSPDSPRPVQSANCPTVRVARSSRDRRPAPRPLVRFAAVGPADAHCSVGRATDIPHRPVPVARGRSAARHVRAGQRPYTTHLRGGRGPRGAPACRRPGPVDRRVRADIAWPLDQQRDRRRTYHGAVPQREGLAAHRRRGTPLDEPLRRAACRTLCNGVPSLCRSAGAVARRMGLRAAEVGGAGRARARRNGIPDPALPIALGEHGRCVAPDLERGTGAPATAWAVAGGVFA